MVLSARVCRKHPDSRHDASCREHSTSAWSPSLHCPSQHTDVSWHCCQAYQKRGGRRMWRLWQGWRDQRQCRLSCFGRWRACSRLGSPPGMLPGWPPHCWHCSSTRPLRGRNTCRIASMWPSLHPSTCSDWHAASQAESTMPSNARGCAHHASQCVEQQDVADSCCKGSQEAQT